MVTIQEQWTSPNSTPNAQVPSIFGQPRNVTSITIHHWGDPAWGQTFAGVVSYLCDGNRPNPTSAHYIVEAGQAACIVTPDDAAWHAGSPVGNATSIGIECNPLERDGDYQTVAEVIQFIRGIYGDIPLVPHNHWIQTDCPGTYDLNRLDALARGTQPTPAPIQEGFLMALTDQQQQDLYNRVMGGIPAGSAVDRKDSAGNPARLRDTGDRAYMLGMIAGGSEIWIGDGLTRRHIADPQQLADIQYLANIGKLNVDPTVYKLRDLDTIGSPVDLPAIKQTVSDALAAGVHVSITA